MYQAAISSINITYETKQKRLYLIYNKRGRINWQKKHILVFVVKLHAIIDELCCEFYIFAVVGHDVKKEVV